jgi:cysteine-rich repeat protein
VNTPSICTLSCGNGVIDGGENCDDNRLPANGDGCSITCQEEPGFACVGSPSLCGPETCGDGVV